MRTNTNPWGDCTDTVLHSKPLNEWYKDWPKLSYNVFQLPSQYSFDLEHVQQQVKSVLDKNSTISITKNAEGSKFSRYRGLGFYSRKNSESPLEDHFIRRDQEHGVVYPDDLHLNAELPDLYENDFTEPTEILTEEFSKLFSVFKSQINKASLLDLRSGGWLGSHVDFPYYKTVRLHATLFGGENAWYEIEGKRFQIPSDGNWYFIDTGKYHSVWNNGPDHRLTLNVNLSIYENRDLGNLDPYTLALNSML